MNKQTKRSRKHLTADECVAQHASKDLHAHARFYAEYKGSIQLVRARMKAALLYPTREEDDTNEHYKIVLRASAYRFLCALDATDLVGVTNQLAAMVLEPRLPDLLEPAGPSPFCIRRKRVPRAFEKFIKSLDTQE